MTLPTIRFAHDLEFLGSPLPPAWLCESDDSRGEGITPERAYQHWLMNRPGYRNPNKATWWKRLGRDWFNTDAQGPRSGPAGAQS